MCSYRECHFYPISYVSCGVPQGYMLGSLLFILYINDIVMCLSILIRILFADDTNLFYSDSDILKLFNTLNCELCKLSDCFKANKLSLNSKKTNYILFTNRKVNLPELNLELNIYGIVLDCVDHSKFLGVIIDKKLSWSAYINYISLKISRGLGDCLHPGCIIDTLSYLNSPIFIILLYCLGLCSQKCIE